MSRISSDDFVLANGNTDWKAYDDARKANGDKCYRCGGYIMFGGNGYRQLCGECTSLNEDKDEVNSSSRYRCPKCRHQGDFYEEEDYDVFSEGDHQITCAECNHEFEIVTSVTYSFQSPELEDESEESAEKDEEDETS